MLHLQSLQKSYGPLRVLHIEEAFLPAGNCWLRGPNGSGKSTLLRILAGLSSFSGTVSLNGIDLRRRPRAYRAGIGWSEAEPVFPEFMSGAALLQLVADARGVAPTEAYELAERLQFKPFLSQATGTYSSGMHKKLSLLLAFCGRPSLVLLDEPLSTLDAAAATALQHYLAAYTAGGDRLCLFSSHQAPEPAATSYETTLDHGNLVRL